MKTSVSFLSVIILALYHFDGCEAFIEIKGENTTAYENTITSAITTTRMQLKAYFSQEKHQIQKGSFKIIFCQAIDVRDKGMFHSLPIQWSLNGKNLSEYENIDINTSIIHGFQTYIILGSGLNGATLDLNGELRCEITSNNETAEAVTLIEIIDDNTTTTTETERLKAYFSEEKYQIRRGDLETIDCNVIYDGQKKYHKFPTTWTLNGKSVSEYKGSLIFYNNYEYNNVIVVTKNSDVDLNGELRCRVTEGNETAEAVTLIEIIDEETIEESTTEEFITPPIFDAYNGDMSTTEETSQSQDESTTSYENIVYENITTRRKQLKAYISQEKYQIKKGGFQAIFCRAVVNGYDEDVFHYLPITWSLNGKSPSEYENIEKYGPFIVIGSGLNGATFDLSGELRCQITAENKTSEAGTLIEIIDEITTTTIEENETSEATTLIEIIDDNTTTIAKNETSEAATLIEIIDDNTRTTTTTATERLTAHIYEKKYQILQGTFDFVYCDVMYDGQKKYHIFPTTWTLNGKSVSEYGRGVTIFNNYEYNYVRIDTRIRGVDLNGELRCQVTADNETAEAVTLIEIIDDESTTEETSQSEVESTTVYENTTTSRTELKAYFYQEKHEIPKGSFLPIFCRAIFNGRDADLLHFLPIRWSLNGKSLSEYENIEKYGPIIFLGKGLTGATLDLNGELRCQITENNETSEAVTLIEIIDYNTTTTTETARLEAYFSQKKYQIRRGYSEFIHCNVMYDGQKKYHQFTSTWTLNGKNLSEYGQSVSIYNGNINNYALLETFYSIEDLNGELRCRVTEGNETAEAVALIEIIDDELRTEETTDEEIITESEDEPTTVSIDDEKHTSFISIEGYSEAVEFNGVIYTSGHIGVDPVTGLIVNDDIQYQAKQALENMDTLLTQAGSSFNRIIKCTVYLIDIDDLAAFNNVYREFFPDNNNPARSVIQVTALPQMARVQIECIVSKAQL